MAEEKDLVTEVVLKTPAIRPSVLLGGAVPDSAASALNQMQAQEQAFLSAGGYDVPREPEKHTVGPVTPPPGTSAVDLGTAPGAVERFAAATQKRELLPTRVREEGLPARTNLESASEAVRDFQTQPGRPVSMRQELDIAGRATGQATGHATQRVADIAQGREKGFIGQVADRMQMDLGGSAAVLDALLEAISLPSIITGEALAEDLKQHGVDPAVADNIGLAVTVGTGLGYGAAAPTRRKPRLKRR